MTATDATDALPLAGLRVLELATLYAAPLAGSILADFGADVIKVEPPEGDLFRGTPMWRLVSRGKRSVRIDVRDPAGQETVRALSREVDVVIENVPAKVMRRWGLGYEDLHRENPDLVVVSVSCFGAGGPHADRPGSGTLAEAFGGLTHLTGEADGPPMLPSIALGDAVNAMSAVIGILVASRAKDHGVARGQHVDLAMYEPILQLVGPAVTAHRPGAPAPARTGSRLANPSSIRNVFATADGGWVAISCSTSRHQDELVEIVGGTLDTPLPEADRLTAEWIAARDLEEVVAVLVERRIPGVPVNDLAAIAADEHVRARGSLVPVGDGLGVAPVPRLSETPGRVRSAGPELGEHDAEILGRLRQRTGLPTAG